MLKSTHGAKSFRVFIAAAMTGAVVLLSACHKKSQMALPPAPPPVMAKPAPPEPIPAPIADSIPSLPPAPDFSRIGDDYLELRNYPKAAEAYQIYLRGDHAAGAEDRVLFRLALTHALPDSPIRDLNQATSLLQQLVKMFPDSPYRMQAEYVLALQGEVDRLHSDVSKRDDRIRDLTQELERLKEIDMQRRPLRAPK